LFIQEYSLVSNSQTIALPVQEDVTPAELLNILHSTAARVGTSWVFRGFSEAGNERIMELNASTGNKNM